MKPSDELRTLPPPPPMDKADFDALVERLTRGFAKQVTGSSIPTFDELQEARQYVLYSMKLARITVEVNE